MKHHKCMFHFAGLTVKPSRGQTFQAIQAKGVQILPGQWRKGLPSLPTKDWSWAGVESHACLLIWGSCCDGALVDTQTVQVPS